MSADTSAKSAVLHDPAVHGTYVPPLDIALSCARETLAEHASASIYDHDQVLRAAISLDIRLRQLVAALDEANGEVSGA